MREESVSLAAPELFTCHLLDVLEKDLCRRIRKLGLSDPESVQNVVREAVLFYSNSICQEKPQLDRLRTQQRELQSAIHRKDQFLAHILKGSADAILTVDPEQRVVIWNQGAELIFGYQEEEITGKPVSLLLPPGRESDLRQIEEDTRRTGSVNNRLARWITKEGRVIQIMLTSTAIRDAKGRFSGSSFVIKDVTRQREMEEAVRQAEHFSSIGHLAAGLAHEIKNPLAGIQGAIEVIKDHMPDGLEQDILSDVLGEVGRIDKIVRDLLNYAKPKAPELKPLRLERLVKDQIRLLQESTGRRVSFRLSGEPGQGRASVLGDEGYLKQVLMNLLLNALEAMEGHGTIRIHFETDTEVVAIRIQDSGPGVPISIQHKIFDPFFTTKKSGTGLGLAICRRIVHDHGGSLTVDTDCREGAAFVLRLPCQGTHEK